MIAPRTIAARAVYGVWRAVCGFNRNMAGMPAPHAPPALKPAP